MTIHARGLLVCASAVAGTAFLSVAMAADISGAGATFPAPVYSKWAEAYKKETNVGLNYQSIGSGGGIKQIEAGTVTFGASDKPLEQKELQDNGLVQWPMIIGGVVPTVNIEGVKPGELVLDGATVADIYLGTISKWNDPKIKALNPSVNLPNLAIAPPVRAIIFATPSLPFAPRPVGHCTDASAPTSFLNFGLTLER